VAGEWQTASLPPKNPVVLKRVSKEVQLLFPHNNEKMGKTMNTNMGWVVRLPSHPI
jgi:hypothetical protein